MGGLPDRIRPAAYSGLPLGGTVLVVWVMNRHLSADWVTAAYNLISCVAHLAPLLALVHRFDRPGDRLPLRFCRRTARLCGIAFAAALVFGALRARGAMVTLMLVAGVLGVLVTVPGVDLVRRAWREPGRAGWAALGAVSYYTNTVSSALWERYATTQIAPVVAVARLCSSDVAAGVVPYGGGHAILLQSAAMELLIAESCNAFPFCFLFVSLVASVCVAATPAVRLACKLGAIAALVALANEARVADLFCFGEALVRERGRNPGTAAVIDLYHEVGACFVSVWSLAVFLLAAQAAHVDVKTGSEPTRHVGSLKLPVRVPPRQVRCSDTQASFSPANRLL